MNQIPVPLIETKERVFDLLGLQLLNPMAETESVAYSAFRFQLSRFKMLFREAKITPTKTGQFVTLWKRIAKGPIEPFDLSDAVDLFIINTRTETNFGQFVFSKEVLSQHGIITTGSKEGKRAIRVYPPWNQTTNKQAQKTQKWQLDYFLEIPFNKPVDLNRAKALYFQNK